MSLRITNGLIFLGLILAVFFVWEIDLAYAHCQDECVASYQKRCVADDLGWQECGNFDGDSCLEWSSVHYCPWGKMCGDDFKCVSFCQDECQYPSQRRCVDGSKGWQVCGNYDGDKCLEWSHTTYCQDDKVCQSGECGYACGNECDYAGQKYCLSDNTAKVCGYYDSDPCLDWQTVTCSGSTECGYGRCSDNQRPYWRCYNGKCDYECLYRSSCDLDYSANKQDHLGCYDGDVYWFDERGRRQAKKQECGNYYCHGWSDNYCVGNKVYRKKACFQPTCLAGVCKFEENPVLHLQKECPEGTICQSGDCVVNTCQCSSGPCCDGCHYYDENKICNTESQKEYGCPWGESCGSAVGARVRTKYQYCSGDSAVCRGGWSAWGAWTGWLVEEGCASSQACQNGSPVCHTLPECQQLPVNGDDEEEDSSQSACLCPEGDEEDGGGLAAFLSLDGLKKILLSWLFWLLVALVAVAILLAKKFEMGDYLARRKLKQKIAGQA